MPVSASCSFLSVALGGQTSCFLAGLLLLGGSLIEVMGGGKLKIRPAVIKNTNELCRKMCPLLVCRVKSLANKDKGCPVKFEFQINK